MPARTYSLFRAARGNVTVLTAASLIVVVACVLFALWYVSHNSNSNAQHTAIEAAALTAAGDIGRIVIHDSRFGNVGLCDAPPAGTNGTTPAAGDNYFTQVKSINEIIGSCRLEAMIADCIGDSFIKAMAEDDLYYATNTTLPNLDNSVKAALGIPSSGSTATAKDINGNTIDALTDATNIYKQNQIVGTDFVDLTLSFGALQNGMKTNIPVPVLPTPPSGCNAISDSNGQSAANQIGGCYRSDMDLSYGGDDYIFAAVGSQPTLVDFHKFQSSISGLAYQNPGVVLCTAHQTFHEQGRNVTQAYSAAATSGAAVQSPAAGAISFSFPDGPVYELACPLDLFDWAQMQNAQANLATATIGTGDYPVQQNSTLGSPTWTEPGTGGNSNGTLASWGSSGSAPASNIAELSVYDWLRCGGSHAMLADPPGGGSAPAGASAMRIITALTQNWDQPGSGLAASIPAQVQWITHAPLAAPAIAANVAPITGSVPTMTPPSNLTTYTDSHGHSVNQSIPGGIQYVYKFQADGSVAYKPYAQTPQPYLVVGEGQLYAESVGQGVGSAGTGGVVSNGGSGGGGHHHGNGPPPWQITLPDMLVPQQPNPPATLSPNPANWTWLVNGGGQGPAPPGGVNTGNSLQMSGSNIFDFYGRDYCRQPGSTDGTNGSTDNAGQHNGADMDMPPQLSWKNDHGSGGFGCWGGGGGHGNPGGPGKGLPPMISQQVDFLLTSTSSYPAVYDGYTWGASGGANRSTYANGGLVADLRFRREVNIGILSSFLVTTTSITTVGTTTSVTTSTSTSTTSTVYNSNTGYISEMLTGSGGNYNGPSGNGQYQHAAVPPGSP